MTDRRREIDWPAVMTAKTAALYLNIGKSKFFELVAEGKVVPRKLGRGKVYRRADLDRLIANLPLAR